MTSALEGIKIIDLSRVGPGPFATMLLADLGADVIRIDEPARAEEARRKSSSSRGKTIRAYNSVHNRNKKSIVLNLKDERGRQILLKLASTSDVIVEGFRPGVSGKLGVDYETLKSINPGIIYCSITGYGQDGPYQSLPGHDINYISIAGALGLIGEKGGPPTIPLNLLADFAGGSLQAVIGIFAALTARGQTGRGQYVDIAMVDGVVSLLAGVAADYFINNANVERGEYFLSGGTPYYNIYETKDKKYISIAANEPWFWQNLCRAFGREDFIPYQGAEDEKKEEIFSCFRQTFFTKTRDEWFDFLKPKNVPVAPVHDIGEVFSDPQVLHRQMVVEDAVTGIKQVGISTKLSDTPGSIRSPAPILGQHTKEILLSLGYTGEDIRELGRDNVVVLSESSTI